MRLIHAAILGLLIPGAALAQVTDNITEAQPKLPTTPITIISRDGTRHLFQAEQAVTQQQQTTGLMFRTEIPADSGMLFDWGTSRDSEMWMRNCPVVEDMVFINEDGTIRHIAENTVPQSEAIIDSGGPVRATLELQGGITEKLGISVGDRVVGGPFPGK